MRLADWSAVGRGLRVLTWLLSVACLTVRSNVKVQILALPLAGW